MLSTLTTRVFVMESSSSSFWEYLMGFYTELGVVFLIVFQLAVLSFNSIKLMLGNVAEVRMAADASTLTAGMTGVATASGMLSWINSNAPALGVILSALSLLVALIFYILNYRLNRKQMDERLRDEILKELEGAS